MKITKKLEAEILKIYQAYWDAYLAGDMKTFASMLDDNIKVFGTAVSEVFNNKAETVRFYKATADQMTGKAEFRNRKIKMNSVDKTVLIHEQCDLFVLIENEWIFYGPVRVSALFVKTPKGWKLTHQHGSFPDNRAEAGEQIAPEKIKKENLELREAIKRRTVELENKNRELEIEASLEKVRTIAMGMREPADMLDVCKTISIQLQSLGVKEIRNVQTAIIYVSKSIYINYEYYAKHKKQFITEVDFKSHYYQKLFVNKMLKGTGEIFTKTIKGKKVKEWYEHQKTTNQFADRYLGKSKSLSYYWFSLGPIALGISTYSPLSEEELNLFIRFRNVFELAYRRYLDIEKAEAQAREAKIEASLERVRAVAMSMHKSDDLISICEVSYKEFQKLGFNSLRNAIIHIPNDENKYFMDYDFSDLTGGAITKIEYGSHPVVEDYLKQIKSAKNAFAQTVLKEDQLEEWKDFRRNSGQIDDPRLDKATALYYYFFSIGIGDIGISTLEPINESQIKILKRFRNVFDLAYRRYTDITRAEAQAKEAQIELALERVRARTMAMQKSDELKEVVASMFDGMKSLGVDPTVCNIALVDRKTCDTDVWTAHQTDNGMITYKVFISHFEHPFRKKLLDSFLNEIPFSVHELSGDLKKSYAQYLFEHVDYSNVPAEVTKSNEELANMEAGIVLSAAYMKYGLLIVSRNHPISNDESDILQRFAKIFEQTYTRFLDLQKAESQAREAQIEAALERVRSRSMAMHKSEEFPEVIQVVFEQFRQLNFKVDSAQFDVSFRETDDLNLWTAVPGRPYPTRQHIPFTENAVFNSIKKAKEAGLDFVSNQFTVEEKTEFFEYFFKHVTNIPEERRKFILSSPGFFRSVVILDKVSLGIQNYSGIPYTDTEHAILKRFAKAFEQTYTRFLDLQRAEAQAREAQIETALERVRSRTMGMQKSEDLKYVVATIFEKLSGLNIEMNGGMSIATFVEDSKDLIHWVVNPALVEGAFEMHLNYFPSKVYDDFNDARDNDKEILCVVYNKEELTEYFGYAFKFTGFAIAPDDAKRWVLDQTSFGYTAAIRKHSAIFFNDYTGKFFSEEENAVLLRFSNVFEQAYVRFLDLQKAEAQAREAQIQASLERLRAKSMSMQQSDELHDVLAVLCEQFDILGILPMSTHMTILDIENNKFTFRETGKFGNRSFGEHTFALDAMDTWKDMVESWRNSEPFTINRLHFPQENLPQVWEVFYESFASMPEESRITPDDYPDGIYHTAGKHPFGYIGMNQVRPATTEEEQIVIKFANEFGRAYQRFLDLQKAEAQAREAQIEAALERIRAAAMSMRDSSELSELIYKLYGELTKLDAKLDRCFIMIVNPENHGITWWLAGKEGLLAENGFYIKMNQHPSHLMYLECWEKHKKKWQYLFEGKEKRDWDSFGFSNTELARLPEFIKKDMAGVKKIHLSGSSDQFGSLVTGSLEPLPEEQQDIISRFTIAFNQAFIRFLDLQKAEAQAREAQIEAALERVRSRTMGMQKSVELKDVIRVVYEQFVHLKINVDHAGFVVDYTPKGDWHFWIADDQDIPSKITHPYFESVWANQFNEAKEKGADFFATNLNFEEKNKFYNELLSYVPGLPEASKDFYLSCPGLAATTVLLENVSLYIENFSGIPYTDEENNTLMRFGKVFQQTYTRFLDLEKAEAQAREAQIEAALEKIRARALAMRNSSEVGNVSTLLFLELEKMNVNPSGFSIMIFDEVRGKYELWRAKEVAHQGAYETFSIKAMYDKFDQYVPGFSEELKTAWSKGNLFFIGEFRGENRDSFLQANREMANYSDETFEEMKKDWPDPTFWHLVFFKYGWVGVLQNKQLIKEELLLIHRFAEVFDFAYTRFLDLQKAETQAREAKIEASLERVRSKAMAMHSPNDLSDTVNVFFKELKTLGIIPIRCGVGQIDEATRTTSLTTTTSSQQGESLQVIGKVKQTGHPVLDGIFDHWKLQKEYHPVLKGKDIKAYYGVMNAQIGYPEYPEGVTQYGNNFFFKEGFVFAWTENLLSEEELIIFRRFTSVLSLTYRRYKDLKEAEAQAKEAQIEAALERVRSRTMGMQKSDELAETVSVLFKQLLDLGVKSTQLRTCGIATFKENEPKGEIWITDITGEIISDSFDAPYDEAPAYKTIYSKWKSGEKFLKLNLKGDAFLEHLNFVKKYSGVPNINLDEIKKLYTEIFIHIIYFSQGYLFIISYEALIEYHEIFKRFGALFHQTYTRFLDFKKVEAQNKIIQVENERKTKELEDARQLQLAMLPRELPKVSNLDIAVYMKTATEVGGDYYDFNFDINGTLTVVLGDATGHGMMSGMMVSIMKSFFISNKVNIELKQFFENANNSIKDMNLGRLMMSFMGVQITSNKVIATNAGMPSLIYFRNKSQRAGEFVSNNLPLGAMKGTKYLLKEIVYEKGDALLLMSDGFAELKNKNNEQYGYPRIIEEFRTVAHKDSDAIVEHLKNSATEWIIGVEPDDDVTIVVIKIRQ